MRLDRNLFTCRSLNILDIDLFKHDSFFILLTFYSTSQINK